jgi:UDP-4-amino-4,6-dideoxy-N-acetyl-beta-L-altrosamine N-acetyltransferase
MVDQAGQSDVKGKDASKPVLAKAKDDGELVTGVRIAKLDQVDIPQIRHWRNDYRIWQWCRQHDFISDVEHEDWFRRQSSDPNIKMYKIIAVTETKSAMIGVCGLTDIDLVNRRAEFSLYIAPNLQGKGFGRAGLTCLLTHGFSNLGLNVIWGESFDNNPAIRIFQKLGFVKEGTRRDFYFRDGKFVDAHLYSMRASEWKSN